MKAVRFWLYFAVTALASRHASSQILLSKEDVQEIIAQATTRASEVDDSGIIAVVDREGYVLGVWDVSGDPNPDPEEVAAAISRAGTAAFLSSNQNAFTSRTAGYIIQQHFPPFVRNTPPGPLVGVGISNVFLGGDTLAVTSTNSKGKVTTVPAKMGGHSDVNFFKQIPPDMTGTFDPNSPLFDGVNPFSPNAVFPKLPGARSPGTFGAAIFTGTSRTTVVPGIGAPGTSLNDSSGGVPLYKDGVLVGGVGVTGAGDPINISTGFAIILAGLGKDKVQQDATPGFEEGPDPDEDVALAGQMGYEPDSSILATNDYLGGIQIPYVETTTDLGGVMPFGSHGVAVTGYPVQKSPPPFNYPVAEFGGVAGEIRFPIRDDPLPGRIGKTLRLTAGEVTDIISNAAARSAITRAGIRLPLGVSARVFISVVGNPLHLRTAPPILGVFRTGEATIFSWDVAVQKARTAIMFSNDDLAESSRTVGFLAQRYYPPGIDGNPPGPYFGVQEALLIDQFLGHANPYLPNQITVFPGGFPLYRNGVLIGAIGVSGDGVDQDDIISASGCVDFLAPDKIRADRFMYRGARLPYAKFPRDPAP